MLRFGFLIRLNLINHVGPKLYEFVLSRSID